MKDPHVHVEKTILRGFGNQAMRELIIKGTGLAPDIPKTVSTGCGRRRPFAMTSTVPERVTCLACREWAAAQYLASAESAERLVQWYEREPELMNKAGARVNVTPAVLAEQARRDRAVAARYEVKP